MMGVSLISCSSNEALASRESDPLKLNGTFDSDLSYEELQITLQHAYF
jgi:hypothetical protein